MMHETLKTIELKQFYNQIESSYDLKSILYCILVLFCFSLSVSWYQDKQKGFKERKERRNKEGAVVAFALLLACFFSFCLLFCLLAKPSSIGIAILAQKCFGNKFRIVSFAVFAVLYKKCLQVYIQLEDITVTFITNLYNCTRFHYKHSYQNTFAQG